ncbi:MAG: hypothetical protein AAB892_00495 [Patescibacteria group bacterium]
MRNRERKPGKLGAFELPQGRPAVAGEVYRALEAEFPDPQYPPHDEEKFQEGYPHQGSGGYGSPEEF